MASPITGTAAAPMAVTIAVADIMPGDGATTETAWAATGSAESRRRSSPARGSGGRSSGRASASAMASASALMVHPLPRRWPEIK
ncbi:hypothetical protein GCM10022251_14260 [Phytohabitans flavus]